MSAYRNIVVAVDGSEAAERGLAEAMRLAKSEGAALCLLHVVNENVPYTPLAGGAPPVDVIPLLKASGQQILEQALARVRGEGIEARGLLVESPEYSAASDIVAQAKKLQADLIVLGTHGRRGLRRLVMGSDAELVLRSTTVPVLLVRATS